MLIHLHSQATTTPKIRAAIQASREPAPVLAERYGVTKPLQNHAAPRCSRHGTPIGALCPGAWILGEGWFLDGMKAAIRWEFRDSLWSAFPR